MKQLRFEAQHAANGTANFGNRSFRLNFEVTAIITDADFASQMKRMFEDDFENSYLVNPHELEGRSYWFRLGVRLARLTSARLTSPIQ